MVHCADEADSNYCDDAFSVDLNICYVFDSTGIANPVANYSTINSYHYTDGSVVADEGGDFYRVD
ncbi:MAG TPA: hypothetical protein VN493_16060 [Thermoanaerobaculia bacterium]|nr:hypothetical protein [Thermoanaerobaculia bacterium]